MGLQPARRDQQAQRRAAHSRCGASRSATAFRKPRRSSIAASCTCRTAATTCRRSTRATGELLVGVSTRSSRKDVTAGTEPQPRDLGHDADRCRRRQHAVRDRRTDRQARLGDAGARRRRRERARRPVRSSPTARSSRAGNASPTRRTKPASSRRTTRPPARSCGARARFRGRASPAMSRWGGVPMEQRWHVGTWMVPSFDPELNSIYVGTSVTIPAAKFILGGSRQAAPLSQLDARARRRYRTPRLVLPASRRPLGSRPSVRAPARRYARRAESERSALGSIRGCAPASAARSSREFPARPASSTRSIARPASSCGRARRSTRTSCATSTARRARVTVDPERVYTRKDQTIIVCPGMNGGKNWPAGAYSPRTNAMYMPMQNLCMTRDHDSDQRDPSARLRPRAGADARARRRQDGRRLGGVGGDRRDAVASRAARRRHVDGRDRRRPRVRRRRRRALQSL